MEQIYQSILINQSFIIVCIYVIKYKRKIETETDFLSASWASNHQRFANWFADTIEGGMKFIDCFEPRLICIYKYVVNNRLAYRFVCIYRVYNTINFDKCVNWKIIYSSLW